jgi:hypothetical protein
VSQFATPEPQGYLGFITFIQETYQVAQFYLIIPFVRAWTKFHFLDLNLFLFFLGFLQLFILLKLEFAVVHDAANRGFGIRGNFYKIQFSLFRDPLGLRQGNDTDLFAFLIDQAYFPAGDFIV